METIWRVVCGDDERLSEDYPDEETARWEATKLAHQGHRVWITGPHYITGSEKAGDRDSPDT